MKISIEEHSSSKIELKIEIPAEEFKNFVEKATLKLGENLEIEGFRKGRAPKEMIEREIGQEKILFKAAELTIKKNYPEAIRQVIKENRIEPLGQPKIEILKIAPDNPFVFKATIQVLPEIKLADYKRIASGVKRRKISIQDSEVEDALLWLQRSRAKFRLKDSLAQKGDFVEIEFSSPQIDLGKVNQDAFILGQGRLIPGFEKELEGTASGQEKEFSLSVPENYHKKEIAGKEITFKVKIKSIQKIEPPEINDEFAKNLGNFSDLDQLRQNIKKGLVLEKENQERQRVHQEIIERVSQDSQLEIPEILIVEEKKRLSEELREEVSQNLKISFQDYLNRIKKSEKELEDSLSAQAEKRVKNYLVLREIGKRENIEASEEEIKTRINEVLKHYPTPKAAQEKLDLETFKEYTEEAIKNEKTFELLEKMRL